MRTFAYGEASPHRCSKRCCALVAQISEDMGRMGAIRQIQPDLLDDLARKAFVDNIEASTRVEGIYPDPGVVDRIVAGSEPQDDTQRQIAGLAQAQRIVHEQAGNLAVAPSTVLTIHDSLFELPVTHRRSRYRRHDTMTMLIDGMPQQVTVSPISAFETPLYLGSACDALNAAIVEPANDGERHSAACEALLPIPMFAVDFLCIRPFDQGNGRIIRLFSEFLMLRSGVDICRYTSLNRLIERDGMAYYDALNACTDGWTENMGTYEPFIEYWLGTVHEAYRQLFDHVELAQGGQPSKSERVRLFFEHRRGRFGKSDVLEANPDISVSTVENALAELTANGYLVKIGAGRGTKYERSRQDTSPTADSQPPAANR